MDNQEHPQHQGHHGHQPPPPPVTEPPVPTFQQQYTPAPATFTPPQPAQVPPQALTPQPMVNVLSPRGVEYVFMTIALFTGAIGFASILISLVNGDNSFEVLAFPVALLLVALPVFAVLFLRLKNAELANPALRLDASKRRSTQFIQIVTFLICFFTVIGFVTTLFAKLSGNFDSSMFKVFLDIFVILLVSGGILTYYWRDEHRS